MFSDYEIEDHLKEAKGWYDGYRFGEEDLYCPWDVINYVDRIASNPDTKPEAFWINSSGNDLVKRFIDKADASTRSEIERLISGDMIEKKVRLDSAYDELDSTIDNLWSVLFTTGYLTQKGMGEDGSYKLVIPNREVREVFIDQIQEWFKEKIRNDKKPMSELLCSFLSVFGLCIKDAYTLVEDYIESSLNSLCVSREERTKELRHRLFVVPYFFLSCSIDLR